MASVFVFPYSINSHHCDRIKLTRSRRIHPVTRANVPYQSRQEIEHKIKAHRQPWLDVAPCDGDIMTLCRINWNLAEVFQIMYKNILTRQFYSRVPAESDMPQST